MKIRRALLIIPLLALLPAPFLWLAPFLWPVLDRALTVYATPEMQTPFLQAYNPHQVLDRFRTVENIFSQGPSTGCNPGYGFATRERVFDEPLIIQSAGYPALIYALNAEQGSDLSDHRHRHSDGFRNNRRREWNSSALPSGKERGDCHHRARRADREPAAVLAATVAPGRDSHTGASSH
jgi:hypothetical protein